MSGIVVVGAGLAGLRGAEALRESGYAGALTLVGAEPHRPYDRPPLSKHVLTGELAPEDTTLPGLVPLQASWRLGQAAVGLDRVARTIQLADGATVSYEKLLVATGARARTWSGEGAGLAGLFTIRGRDDAAALRAALKAKPRRVLIVGAGLIGCETASCCRGLGLAVTLVDPGSTPFARSLGVRIGSVLVGLMRKAGVEFRPGRRVLAFEGEEGRVVRARLDDGTVVQSDCVIVALGAVRDTDWLTAGGLAADAGGLACDAACHALTLEGVPDPNIFAAGDVARWPNAVTGGDPIGVEHWGNAVVQARHAASNMLADPHGRQDYDHLPAFWSQQFGINIKAVGLADGADAVAVVQGSLPAARFLAVYGRGGRTIAAVSFDQARWLPAYAAAIEAGAAFPPIVGATDQPRIRREVPGFPPPRQAAEREPAHA